MRDQTRRNIKHTTQPQGLVNQGDLDGYDDDTSAAAEHEAQHARGRVDARVCQGVGCPRGDA